MPSTTLEPLRLPDGTAIFLREWAVPDAVARRGSVLLVHGLGEHSGRYAHVAEMLAAMGLHVRGYDHRGHGESPGDRGAIPHPAALLDELRAVFEDLDAGGRAAGDTAAPFLLGHSLGGTTAARAATGGWVTPRGLILSSPALRVSPNPVESGLLAVARRLAPDRGLPNRLPVGKLSHDPREVAAYKADGLNHDRITPRLYDFLVDAGAAARRDAAAFTVPTLLLVAGADAIVDARGARELSAALPPGVGTLHWYDGLYHELFNEREPDRTLVLDDLAVWLEEQLDQTGSHPTGRSP
jgi:alpha-beta hydrolase superfamily lysophospholipase